MRDRRNRQKGQALMATIIGVSLVLLLLLVTLTVSDTSRRLLARQLTYSGQALNAAQAGLTEGQSWFRRQATQPVTNFAPLQNLSAIPPIADTQDPLIGLTRSYPISGLGRVWGRYELKKTGFTGPPATQTIDISKSRDKQQAGVFWQLESLGIVFVNNDPTKAYNVKPNVVIARRILRTEMQRLAMKLPANAALNTSRGDCVNIVNGDVEINGNGSTGIAWVNTPAGSVPIGTCCVSPQVKGGVPLTTNSITATPNKFTIPAVFGMTLQDLRSMANIEVTTVAALPASLPQMSIIILNNPGTNFVFTSTRPLNGSGILVVLGNLTIAANSGSVFNGLIYVQGGYSQSQPSTINGAVVIDGSTTTGRNVVFQGAGENAFVSYDGGLLAYVASRLGLYNMTRSPYEPCLTALGQPAPAGSPACD